MDRRKFIAGMGLTAIAAASPVSIDAVERVAKKTRKKAVPRVNQVPKTGKLKLSFFPYELKLRHAFIKGVLVHGYDRILSDSAVDRFAQHDDVCFDLRDPFLELIRRQLWSKDRFVYGDEFVALRYDRVGSLYEQGFDFVCLK